MARQLGGRGRGTGEQAMRGDTGWHWEGMGEQQSAPDVRGGGTRGHREVLGDGEAC